MIKLLEAAEGWQQKYRQILIDYQKLVYSALSINDHLKIHDDHAEFTGSMSDAENFREIVNDLHWKYAHEFTDEILDSEQCPAKPTS